MRFPTAKGGLIFITAVFISVVPCFGSSSESRHHDFPWAKEAKEIRENLDRTFSALMKCLAKNNTTPDEAEKKSEKMVLCANEDAAHKGSVRQFNDGMRRVEAAQKAFAQQGGFTKPPAAMGFKPVPANVFAGASNLPPDPGQAGKQTLAGVDSDNDGVRDDIQRYIALTYPASVKTRAALTQFTKGMQMELLAAASEEKALAAAEQTGNAQYCLHYLFKLDADPLWQALRAQHLNTRERSRAYGDYNHLLDGMVEQLPRDLKSRCVFDPDALPN